MLVQELKCFGVEAGDGNPALVVQDGPAGAVARQAFASARNVAACVFIDGDVLDYYYPHMRSPLCLHATLAAARVLFAQQGSDNPTRVTTALRRQPLILTCAGDDVFVALARQAVEAAAPDAGVLAELLASPGLAPASPPTVASVGSAKLLVEVADSAVLHSLQPDLARIVAWGTANGVNGIYAYCRLGDGAYEGRNFNHLDPAREDRATGVAGGALTALLGHGIKLYQAGRRCLIRTRTDGDAILVGGRA